MLYELDSHEKCGYFPPCVRSVQNLAPFKNHITKDFLPFNPKQTQHHDALWEDENHPFWPNLIGCFPLFSKESLYLHHLYDDGSIYSISYSDKSSKVDISKSPYINTDFINEQESKVFKEYLETKDLLKDSKILKLKPSGIFQAKRGK